ncbi:zinc-finger homeodomain protein 11-like [Durio zibethinus]|uniref:Zinc-finger homeodomain protein 11-like n=1 Tax=Durio zibethinus TaxID=66656 RepID=A0A6P6BF77_DURZI|nr:zinc-finger homeodomain protein 11-like [Durio zibethinus]
MEIINTKTPSFARAESSSETHAINGKTKSLLLLKNCSSNIIYHHYHQEMVVSYKECLKNHAASLGGHALDGCGEFMPSPTANPTDPASLKCAACGCHRNFHRRDPYDGPAFIHHLPPPPNPSSSPSPTHSAGPSPSPTYTPPSPVPYSYYSSAPHMLMALSTGYSGPLDEYHHHLNHSNPTVGRIVNNNNNNNSSGRKRSRTKFSKEQKEKMHAFAERLGWRMPKSEERLIEEFCNEVGVDRGVLKVWMHNNKNTFGKKEILAVCNLNLDNNNSEDNGNGNAFDSNSDIPNNEGSIQPYVSTNNGSSSSS